MYHVVIPSRTFGEGLGLLLDAVANPAFPEEEIGKEKRVVLEEIKMGEDDPQRKLFRELFSLGYAGHPYGRPIIGFEETVKKLDRQTIQAYFKTHYTLERMFVVVAGDFDEQKAADLIARHLLGGKGTARKVDTLPAAPAPGGPAGQRGDGGRSKVVERDLQEHYIALSYPVPSLGHEDMPALSVLATLLGDGESSRLQEELKHRTGIVSNSATYLFTPREAGLFIVYATFRGQDQDRVRRSILRVLHDTREKGSTPEELRKAKNIIRASFVYGAETVQGKARQIGNYATLTGDPAFIDRYLEQIEKVTAEDVQRVLLRYLSGKEPNVVVLKSSAKTNPHTHRLGNGLTWVFNRNDASPSFAFRIGFVGGVKEETKETNGTFNLLSRMLLKGTAGKDSRDIARTIDTLAGDLSPFAGRNSFGLSGKFLAKDSTEVLSLLKELLSSSTFPEKELVKVKREALSEIRQKRDDPVSVTFQTFNEVLYEGHPYAMDPNGSEKSLRGIDISRLKAAYRDYVTPGGAVLALSGNLDEEELAILMNDLFSDWKGSARTMERRIPGPGKAHRGSRTRDILQTHLIFGFPGPGLADEDRYAVEVLDAILSGMGGRIHRILREENPFAYATTFFNHMLFEAGAVGVYIGTDRKYADEVERLVKAEIERIDREGFTAREVENGKSYLVGNHYVRMQSNSAIATSMCLDTLHGLKANYFKTWPSRIDAVTREDVNRVARKYLSLEKMVKVRVGKD